MNKTYGHIILTVMAALFAAACSHHSDIDNEPEGGGGVPAVEQGDPIAFMASQDEEEHVTRATTPLSDEATTFKVWGYKNTDAALSEVQNVFPGYTVNWSLGSAATTSTNSDGWDYVNQQPLGEEEQVIKYWDWGATAYRYFGATQVGTKVTVGKSDGIHEDRFTMVVDASSENGIANTPYFTRLWFSTGNIADYPNQQFGKPVQLEFRKPFARVRFMLTYSYQSEGIKIRSTVFKPTDENSKIACKGTLTVTYPLTGMETTGTREWYEVTPDPNNTGALDAFTEEHIYEGGADREKWYTVLPCTSQGSYTMSVLMNNDTTPKTAVVPAEYMTWLPGYSYTYIFKITEEGGVEIELVQSAVTPWTDLPGEHTVYNW